MNYYPAFRVSTRNSFSCWVIASSRPKPVTFTFDEFPISVSPTRIRKGALGSNWPFFFTVTKCSPVSRGVNEIPAKKKNFKISNFAAKGQRIISKNSFPLIPPPPPYNIHMINL